MSNKPGKTGLNSEEKRADEATIGEGGDGVGNGGGGGNGGGVVDVVGARVPWAMVDINGVKGENPDVDDRGKLDGREVGVG